MGPWALVSPASRGIGLELARRLLQTTKLPLIATARNNTEKTRREILSGAGHGFDESRLEVLELDVTHEGSIEAAAEHCKSRFPSTRAAPSHLHAAFVIPGILHAEKAPNQLDEDKILETFRVNTIGPMLMLKHFSPFLPRKATQMHSSDAFGGGLPASHATWLTMSARVGSISDNSMGGWYSYRASKAAVNQVIKTFDAYLKISAGDKAMAMSYHPGTVKTGLSKDFWSNVKEEKLFSAEFAIDKMLEVIASHEGRIGEARGKCWDWKGEEVKP